MSQNKLPKGWSMSLKSDGKFDEVEFTHAEPEVTIRVVTLAGGRLSSGLSYPPGALSPQARDAAWALLRWTCTAGTASEIQEASR